MFCTVRRSNLFRRLRKEHNVVDVTISSGRLFHDFTIRLEKKNLRMFVLHFECDIVKRCLLRLYVVVGKEKKSLQSRSTSLLIILNTIIISNLRRRYSRDSIPRIFNRSVYDVVLILQRLHIAFTNFL